MVSALYKELEYKVEKLKHKKVGGQAAEDQNQIRISSRWVNHPGSVRTKFYSRDHGLIQSSIYRWRIIKGGEKGGRGRAY